MTFEIVLQSGFSEYSTDLKFQFDIARRLRDGRTRNLTTISNKDPQAARHFAFQPGQENPTLEFRLYNDGTDKSDGTLSASNINDSRFSNDTVETVKEQKIWLNEYVTENTSGPRWTLFGGTYDDRDNDGIADNNGTNVVVQDVSFDEAAGVTTIDGTIDLKLGVTI